MRILITNDDGILAPGIAALYEAVADLGQVDVVAPETTQSAMAHAISVNTPMTVRRVHVRDAFEGWSVDGRPADCVKLAMIELLEQRPTIVLSGINAGSNSGINILYSGTVAGAAEGAFFGVPAIAFSLRLSEQLDFKAAGQVARQVLDHVLTQKLVPGLCLNVNIPDLAAGPPRGVRVCPQATTPMLEHYRQKQLEDGSRVYWLDGREPEAHECPDTDHAALLEQYVTITPLRFDMTQHERLGEITDWRWPSRFV
jgi:5'-nucleotidase